MDVVGRPLAGQPAGWTREPLVVERALLRSERAGGVAPEEMTLLVDVGAGEDVGVRADGVVPPGGAGLLHPDPHEVGWPRDLVGLGPWWRGVEAVLPGRVLAEGMKDRPSGGCGQPGERGHGDPAHAASFVRRTCVGPGCRRHPSRDLAVHPGSPVRPDGVGATLAATSAMVNDCIPSLAANRSNSSRTCSSRATFSDRCCEKLCGCHHRWKMRPRRGRLTQPGTQPGQAQRLEPPAGGVERPQESTGRHVAQARRRQDLVPSRGRGEATRRRRCRPTWRRVASRCGRHSVGHRGPRCAGDPVCSGTRERGRHRHTPGSTGCGGAPDWSAPGRATVQWTVPRPGRPGTWPRSARARGSSSGRTCATRPPGLGWR